MDICFFLGRMPACSHSELIQLSYEDFSRLVKPAVASFRMQ